MTTTGPDDQDEELQAEMDPPPMVTFFVVMSEKYYPALFPDMTPAKPYTVIKLQKSQVAQYLHADVDLSDAQMSTVYFEIADNLPLKTVPLSLPCDVTLRLLECFSIKDGTHLYKSWRPGMICKFDMEKFNEGKNEEELKEMITASSRMVYKSPAMRKLLMQHQSSSEDEDSTTESEVETDSVSQVAMQIQVQEGPEVEVQEELEVLDDVSSDGLCEESMGVAKEKKKKDDTSSMVSATSSVQ